MDKPYKYHLRPAYGSAELLLEFFPGSSDNEFIETLLVTLNEINPKVDSIEDFWMNDEILVSVTSDNGTFQFSKDIWGFVFITATDNQPCVKLIDQILEKSSRFEKEEVDFEKYKNSKK